MQELEENFLQSGGEFREIVLSDYFHISTGSLVSNLVKGTIPRISVKSDNNGILGYFDTETNLDARHAENFISVNFFGNAFYHDYRASLEMKVHILTPKYFELEKVSGLYITSCLNKANYGKFSYGEQLSSSDLKKQDYVISLPFKDKIFALDYMHDYIREIEHNYIREIDAYLKLVGLDEQVSADEVLLHSKNTSKLLFDRLEELEQKFKQSGGVFKEFYIKEIFNVKKGKRLTKANMTKGDIRFIGATRENNGITNMIGNDECLHSPNTITITYNGTVGECFFQEKEFWASDDVNILYPKFNMNQDVALFLISSVKTLKAKYSYNHKWTKECLKKDSIKLPTINNELALNYMHEYIQEIEKFVVRDLILFKKQKLNAYKQAIKE